METVENRDRDRVNGRRVIKGRGGFRPFHEADNVGLPRPELVENEGGKAAGQGRRLRAGRIELPVIEGIHQEPAGPLERSILLAHDDFPDDLSDAHGC